VLLFFVVCLLSRRRGIPGAILTESSEEGGGEKLSRRLPPLPLRCIADMVALS